jgi:hydroxymethylpyrimidine pyrophosphatase-like HAD family hydrolase
MNGPIIAEKGAVIWSSGDALIETSETSEIFMQLRREIVDTLSRYPNISIFIGDNTGLIRSVKHLLSGDELLVAIDSYRRCSLGIFVRTIDDRGILKKSSQATDMIAGIIAPLIPEHPLISDFDPDGKPFGFLKVGPLDADKSTGLKALIETLGDVEEVVMVGDSMSDYIVLSDHIPKIHIFAVDNASSKFKDRADYVSSGSLVTGCVEILRHLKTYECRSS